MPDADLELAARNAASGFCLLTGQVCVAGTRILVHEAVHDEFADCSAYGFMPRRDEEFVPRW
jgi:acyl-CoA reductase-like NAD-dependent aldehyde dehydrogenase